MGKEKNQKPSALATQFQTACRSKKKNTRPTRGPRTHGPKKHVPPKGGFFLRAIDKNQLQEGRKSPHPQESKTLALKSAQVRDYQNGGAQGVEHYGRDS